MIQNALVGSADISFKYYSQEIQKIFMHHSNTTPFNPQILFLNKNLLKQCTILEYVCILTYINLLYKTHFNDFMANVAVSTGVHCAVQKKEHTVSFDSCPIIIDRTYCMSLHAVCDILQLLSSPSGAIILMLQ